MPVPQTDIRYSYDDYITWGDDERWEIIDGVPYNMAPAPKLDHQSITLRFGSFFERVLKNKRCKPYIAPTDVIFSKHDVVQPDVLVVCDPEKYKNGKNIQGAPDVVIEILSPSTEAKDRREKKRLYEHFGVKDFIIVNPESHIAEHFEMQPDGKFSNSDLFDATQSITLSSIDQLEIPLPEIFEIEESINKNGQAKPSPAHS